MSAAVQDFIGQSGIVDLTGRRQRDTMRPLRPDHTLTAKRVPHRFIFQACRVAAGDRGIAQMEMIAMGVWKLRDRDMTIGFEFASLGKARDGLKQGQRAKLQRIELGRIGLRRHRVLQKKTAGPYRSGRAMTKSAKA